MLKNKWIRLAIAAVLLVIMVFSVWKITEPYRIRKAVNDSNKQAQNDFLIFETTASSTQAPPTTPGGSTSQTSQTTDTTTAQTTQASTETSPSGTEQSTTEAQTSSAQTTTLPPQTTAQTTESIWPQFKLNWNAMQRSNPEIIGWIWAYDTTISFPLLQSTDNQKYVTTLYDGVTKGSGGAIFADYRNSPKFTDRNTIIYGHNLNYGVMFGALMRYADADYTRAHPYFCIMTRDGTLKYEIYSVYKTDAYGDTFTVIFPTSEGYAKYLDMALENSLFDTGVVPTEDDLTVTLSTCTNNRRDENERIVIHGRLITE
ncbi:MAG: class B sortase [Clostridia bacterium]|nr:class B sortase [Clostridia bacterium]